MKNNRAYFEGVKFEIREEKDENGKWSAVAEGYAAVFNSRSVDMGFYEEIDQRAFDNTDFSNVIFVINHDPNLLLGRTANSTLKVWPDSEGLRFEAVMPDVTYARDLVVLMRDGYMKEASFMFRVKTDQWTHDEKTGRDIRRIMDIPVVRDVSIVTNGAYRQTQVDLQRSEELRNEYEAWKIAREREALAADVGRAALALAEKRLLLTK